MYFLQNMKIVICMRSSLFLRFLDKKCGQIVGTLHKPFWHGTTHFRDPKLKVFLRLSMVRIFNQHPYSPSVLFSGNGGQTAYRHLASNLQSKM